MFIKIKICGLNHIAAVEAAIEYGATYLGCIFDQSAANYITPLAARDLFADVTQDIKKVASISNPNDQYLDEIVRYFKPDYIQFNGSEKPLYFSLIKNRFDCKIIKSIDLYSKKDIRMVEKYEDFIDMFLFRPSVEYLDSHLANRKFFDWSILRDVKTEKPWMVSGNISKHNVHLILRQSRSRMVDVNYSLESELGLKDPTLIKSFIETVMGFSDAER